MITIYIETIKSHYLRHLILKKKNALQATPELSPTASPIFNYNTTYTLNYIPSYGKLGTAVYNRTTVTFPEPVTGTYISNFEIPPLDSPPLLPQ